MKTILATALMILATTFSLTAEAKEMPTGGTPGVMFLLPGPAGVENAGIDHDLVRSGGSFDLEVKASQFGYSDIEVTDGNGRIIRKVNVTLDPGVNRLHIMVKDLHRGVYYVNIKSGDQTLTRAFEVR